MSPDKKWWRWEELNLRHGAYETPALPLSYTATSRKIDELANGFYRSGCDCARDCAPNAIGRGAEVLRDDLVPVKNAARLYGPGWDLRGGYASLLSYLARELVTRENDR